MKMPELLVQYFMRYLNDVELKTRVLYNYLSLLMTCVLACSIQGCDCVLCPWFKGHEQWTVFDDFWFIVKCAGDVHNLTYTCHKIKFIF